MEEANEIMRLRAISNHAGNSHHAGMPVRRPVTLSPEQLQAIQDCEEAQQMIPAEGALHVRGTNSLGWKHRDIMLHQLCEGMYRHPDAEGSLYGQPPAYVLTPALGECAHNAQLKIIKILHQNLKPN